MKKKFIYVVYSSLAWALLYGEDYVGFTWHSLGNSFNTGDIILQKKIAVKEDETAFILWNKINLQAIFNINKEINLSLYKRNLFDRQDLIQRSFYKSDVMSFEEAKTLIKGLYKNIYYRVAYLPGRL